MDCRFVEQRFNKLEGLQFGNPGEARQHQALLAGVERRGEDGLEQLEALRVGEFNGFLLGG